MVNFIDADSLVYVIAYNFREVLEEPGLNQEVCKSCDVMLRDIMLLSGADDYVGVFSDEQCFRHRIYRYAPYKGNRAEKPDYIRQLKPVIVQYFMSMHDFLIVQDLEADDVVAALGQLSNQRQLPFVICSPDKDLRQVPGLHFDYKKQSGSPEDRGAIIRVSPQEAERNFWCQMLMGDSTDNVAGVPGLGEKKAKACLDAVLSPLFTQTTVQSQYQKYFGAYYGDIIYNETYNTLKLLQPEHLLWRDYADQIMQIPVKAWSHHMDSIAS